MRVDDDVEGAANELLYKTAFTRHPYHWPTIGWMDDIEGFTPEDCVAFYRTYYAPNNATVVVVGDVVEKRRPHAHPRRVRRHPGLGDPGGGHAARAAADDERREVDAQEADADARSSSIGYRGPALGDADHATLVRPQRDPLRRPRVAPLPRARHRRASSCTEVRGWVVDLPRSRALRAVLHGAPRHHDAPDILAALDAELARVRSRASSTTRSSTRAKARLELGLLQSLETTSGKAEQIGFYDTVLGDPAAAFRRLERYRRVTAGEFARPRGATSSTRRARLRIPRRRSPRQPQTR